jgi:hypothetical protein
MGDSQREASDELPTRIFSRLFSTAAGGKFQTPGPVYIADFPDHVCHGNRIKITVLNSLPGEVAPHFFIVCDICKAENQFFRKGVKDLPQALNLSNITLFKPIKKLLTITCWNIRCTACGYDPGGNCGTRPFRGFNV